jgi:uncharacterized protein with HEPN domain
MKRDDGTMLDIADALRKLQTFTADMDETAFRADEKTQAAVLHEFMVLLKMVWTVLCNELPSLKQQLVFLAAPGLPEGRDR